MTHASLISIAYSALRVASQTIRYQPAEASVHWKSKCVWIASSWFICFTYISHYSRKVNSTLCGTHIYIYIIPELLLLLKCNQIGIYNRLTLYRQYNKAPPYHSLMVSLNPSLSLNITELRKFFEPFVHSA